MPAIARFGNASLRAFAATRSLVSVFQKATSFSLVHSQAVNSETFTLPSTIEDGDVGVLWDSPSASSVPSAFYAAGWRPILNTAGARYVRSMWLFKRLTVADRSTVVTGASASSFELKHCYIFRPNVTVYDFLAAELQGVQSSDPASSQVIRASLYPYPSVALACYRNSNNNSINSPVFSPAHDLELSFGSTDMSRMKIQAASGADITVDMGDPGSGTADGILQSFLILPNNAPLVSSVAVETPSNASSISFTRHADMASGDLLVGIMGTNTNNPSNWTDTTLPNEEIDLNDGSGLRLVHGPCPSAAASFSFTNSSSSYVLGGVLLGFKNAEIDVVSEGNHVTGGTNAIVPSITPTAGATVYMAAVDKNPGATWPFIFGWNQVLTVAGSSGPSWAVWRRNTIATGSSTGTVNVDSSSTSGEVGVCMFSVKPKT